MSLTTLSELKEHVCSCLKIPDNDHRQFELGYYEPGRGTKAKKRWLTDADDLEDLKKVYKKKKEILLWCYNPSIQPVSKKRGRGGVDTGDAGPPAPKTKSRSRFESAYEKKMTKVEEIYENLREKHGNKFKPEQLRAWANMIQLDKHSSLESPPVGRFFKSPNQSKSSDSESSATATVTGETTAASQSSAEPTMLSPTKRVMLRTQCIEQLERWHNLMKSGGITKEQYDELQGSILSEVKKY